MHGQVIVCSYVSQLKNDSVHHEVTFTNEGPLYWGERSEPLY